MKDQALGPFMEIATLDPHSLLQNIKELQQKEMYLRMNIIPQPTSRWKDLTVFRIGNSSNFVSTGSVKSGKRVRRRPPAWQRRSKVASGSTQIDRETDRTGKRKSEVEQNREGNKQTKTQENTVAPNLKPVPSQ